MTIQNISTISMEIINNLSISNITCIDIYSNVKDINVSSKSIINTIETINITSNNTIIDNNITNFNIISDNILYTVSCNSTISCYSNDLNSLDLKSTFINTNELCIDSTVSEIEGNLSSNNITISTKLFASDISTVSFTIADIGDIPTFMETENFTCNGNLMVTDVNMTFNSNIIINDKLYVDNMKTNKLDITNINIHNNIIKDYCTTVSIQCNENYTTKTILVENANIKNNRIFEN